MTWLLAAEEMCYIPIDLQVLLERFYGLEMHCWLCGMQFKRLAP